MVESKARLPWPKAIYERVRRLRLPEREDIMRPRTGFSNLSLTGYLEDRQKRKSLIVLPVVFHSKTTVDLQLFESECRNQSP